MLAAFLLGLLVLPLQPSVTEGRVRLAAYTIERRIELAAQGHATIDFQVTSPGLLRVQVAWTGSADNLAIFLNGPGQVGHYERMDGASPATLDFSFTRRHVATEGRWRISIVNLGSGAARGWAIIDVPGRPPRGGPAEPPPPAPPDTAPIKRLLPGGIVETLYPDGRIRQQHVDECNFTIILPDGTHQRAMCVEAIRVELATLPEGLVGDARFGEWLQELGPNLLEAIREIVNDEVSVNNLIAFEEQQNMSAAQRIDVRLRALNRLLRE
jgi:hypothetical protein